MFHKACLLISVPDHVHAKHSIQHRSNRGSHRQITDRHTSEQSQWPTNAKQRQALSGRDGARQPPRPNRATDTTKTADEQPRIQHTVRVCSTPCLPMETRQRHLLTQRHHAVSLQEQRCVPATSSQIGFGTPKNNPTGDQNLPTPTVTPANVWYEPAAPSRTASNSSSALGFSVTVSLVASISMSYSRCFFVCHPTRLPHAAPLLLYVEGLQAFLPRIRV